MNNIYIPDYIGVEKKTCITIYIVISFLFIVNFHSNYDFLLQEFIHDVFSLLI